MFSTSEYEALRPMLWHLTHRDNLRLIRHARRLLPAKDLSDDTLKGPRRGRKVVPGVPVLRDQDLLHESCVELLDGWTMSDYLADLASRVFFWSGWSDRPVEAGRDAAKRYADTDALIRFPFSDLESRVDVQFSRCNSGATRMQHGTRVQRGPSTFRRAPECTFSAAEVVEVSVIGAVSLPASTRVAACLTGPWEPL